MDVSSAESVLEFWFGELGAAAWFKKSVDTDQLCASRFSDVLDAASRGECWPWRQTPEGRLAEIIVLDQFPRNIYRDKPLSFAFDSLALVLAQEAVSLGVDRAVNVERRQFFYMPFMHSESVAVHHAARKLFEQPGLENTLRFELRHLEIIERFGRYPHRNAILGRETTDEERAFLLEPGSAF